MNANKNSWLFITLLGITVVLTFGFIYLSYQKTFVLSLQTYFFVLILFSLAATAFLTNYLKSTAEWSGPPFHEGEFKTCRFCRYLSSYTGCWLQVSSNCKS